MFNLIHIFLRILLEPTYFIFNAKGSISQTYHRSHYFNEVLNKNIFFILIDSYQRHF